MVALGAALLACGEAQDPRLREPVVLAEADLLMAVNGYPTIEAVRAAGAQRTG